MKKNNTLLLKNTVMLYLLQFSSYFFSLITVPYQTRILGPAVYGVIGFAGAVMVYFQLFMDFGFLLSATEDISKNRGDKAYIQKKMTSVSVLKVFLIVISFLVMILMCWRLPKFSEDPKLYLLYLAAMAVNSLMPDYLYRGIEKMTAITVRTVIIKLFFTVLIFVFLKKKEDYLVVPLLLLIGNAGAVIGAFVHVRKKLGYSFTKIAKEDLVHDFRRSLFFFVSRIASTIYSATNTVILGLIDSTGVVTGYYTSADKVTTTAKNGLSPIADSLYPYMVKNRDFALVKKLLAVCMPVIGCGCIVVGIFAEPLCKIAFGADFAGTASILRAMLPAIFAILPSYVLGFPTLGAMGYSKFANTSVLVGTVIHVIGLTVLYFSGHLTAVTIAGMMSVSEWSICLCRLVFVLKYKKAFLQKNAQTDGGETAC